MKNNIYGYAFDIEGTLYNKGKLQHGVVKLFDIIAKINKPVVFVSGMSHYEIKQVVNMIVKKISTPLSYYIASNAGSYITNNKDQQIYQNQITEQELKAIENAVYKYEDAVILYRTSTFNFITVQPNDGNLKGNTLTKITKSNRRYTLIDNTTANALKQSDEIYSIEITTHNEKQLNEIYTQISSVLNKSQALLIGSFIQITHADKWTALRSLFNGNAFNVCYFGDGVNDIKCITNCKYAILTNSCLLKMYDLIEDLSRQNKFATCDLANKTLLKYVTNQEYDEDDLQKLTLKTKTKMLKL